MKDKLKNKIRDVLWSETQELGEEGTIDRLLFLFQQARKEGIEETLNKLMAWCSMRIRDHKQTLDAEFLEKMLSEMLSELKKKI